MRYILVILLLVVSSSAGAEPIGRWFSGYGQGVSEYGIRNDSAGSDYIYIACSADFGTTISITVGGQNPRPNQQVIVVIGADEFVLYANRDGQIGTSSHVDSDNFRAL